MQTLVDYVVTRLGAGRSRADICEELVALGWSKGHVESAYRDALIALGAPMPTGGKPMATAAGVTTGEIVANIFSFILLHIVIWSTVFLCFELIDLALIHTGKLRGADWLHNSIATINRCIASLAIAFPLYVLLMRRWLQSFSGAEPRPESRLTAWLTYIVLLIASIMMVGAMITLLNSLLQVDLDLASALRIAVVFGLSALVFAFYSFERQLVRRSKPARPHTAWKFFSTSVIVLAGAGAAYFMIGVPQLVRSLAFDDRLTVDLIKLSSCVKQFAEKSFRLPETLAQLKAEAPNEDCPMVDPRIGEQYDYRIVTTSQSDGTQRSGAFELCANFTFSSGLQTTEALKSEGWTSHTAGRSCKQYRVQWPAD